MPIILEQPLAFHQEGENETVPTSVESAGSQ